MIFKLANILLEDNDRARNYPDLYCRTSSPIPACKDDGSFILFPYSQFDFATFFNALSVKKWRRYTVVRNVGVHLEISGKAEVTFCRLDATMAAPKRTVLGSIEVDSEAFSEIDYDFVGDDDADMLAFELVTYGMCRIKNSFYYAYVNEGDVRPVELALSTTTFRQEEFILANIDLFKKEIFGCQDDIAQHFTMLVIDNGRTLDAETLSGDGVRVFPNKNVGGAGGFARGMIEAMRLEKPATHVLLMDDDVQISTESLKRTYQLLSIVNDEYKDSYVSGAMMSYERQNEFHEDIGWVRNDGLYGPIKASMEVDLLENVVANDVIAIQKPNRYVGWWYCCIPVETIKRIGLPLPVFIRGDDAEYGNRGATHIITMNGICVWHLTLALKYRAHLERYQVPRNSLIAQSTTGVYAHVDFMEQFRHNFQLDLKTFKYDSAGLSRMALEDYLKGPEFIMEDCGEEVLKKTTVKNEKPVALDLIEDDRVDQVVVDPRMLYDNPPRSLFQRLVDYLFYNGHRLPDFLLRGDLAVIPWDGWFYPSGSVRMHKEVLAVTKDGKQGIVRKMDKRRFKELNGRYKRLMRRYERDKEEVKARYAAAREEMTSEAFWRKYLEI